MTPEEMMDTAMDIGEQMLLCGAEIARVEDSITRICKAYHADRVDVFSITSSLYATLRKDGQVLTQTRRVREHQVDLHRLDLLNDLSRWICQTCPEREAVHARVAEISNQPRWSFGGSCLYSALIAGSFVILFEGGGWDVLVAAALGVLLRLCQVVLQRLHANPIFVNVLTSFCVGVLAMLAVRFGFGQELDKIIIGNIMLLIPGLLLVNGVRDMIARDIMTGILRLYEAIVLSLAIAIGFWAAAVLMGGMLG